MNNMAALSGLVPFMVGFSAVAVISAVVAVAVITQAAANSVLARSAPTPRGPTAFWLRASSSERPFPGAATGKRAANDYFERLAERTTDRDKPISRQAAIAQ